MLPASAQVFCILEAFAVSVRRQNVDLLASRCCAKWKPASTLPPRMQGTMCSITLVNSFINGHHSWASYIHNGVLAAFAILITVMAFIGSQKLNFVNEWLKFLTVLIGKGCTLTM